MTIRLLARTSCISNTGLWGLYEQSGLTKLRELCNKTAEKCMGASRLFKSTMYDLTLSIILRVRKSISFHQM